MSVRQEHRTFQSLFSDPNTCPFGTGDDLKQGIAYAYEPWDTTTTTTSTSDLMEDIITTLSETTGGIAAFQHTEDCPSGTLRIIHGVAKYPGHPGREDAHKRKVFGYLDDVDDLDITTVQLTEFDFEKNRRIERSEYRRTPPRTSEPYRRSSRRSSYRRQCPRFQKH